MPAKSKRASFTQHAIALAVTAAFQPQLFAQTLPSGGHVNFFQQQGPSSVALNRVLGNNPPQIFGNLTANGRVFLVNPSAILFGPTASVHAGTISLRRIADFTRSTQNKKARLRGLSW